MYIELQKPYPLEHMVTTPNGEFEHLSKKYREINKNIMEIIATKCLLMDFFWI